MLESAHGKLIFEVDRDVVKCESESIAIREMKEQTPRSEGERNISWRKQDIQPEEKIGSGTTDVKISELLQGTKNKGCSFLHSWN